MTTKFLQCPYCPEHKGGLGKRVPRTVGSFRVKLLSTNKLIFKCRKCTKTFAIRMIGQILLWDDMDIGEKKTFKQRKWKGGI